MEVEHIKKSLMKWSSRLSRHVRSQHLNTYTVGPRTLWAKTNFVPNDGHDGHQHRGISLLSPHAALSCVHFFSTMRLCSVYCCLCWNLAVPLVLNGAPAAAETSPVLSECPGKENFVWRLSPAGAALSCVLSVAFASFLCVNAFSFCYPYRDSSVEPSN